MVTERPNGQTKHQAEKLLQAHLEAKTTQPADFTKSTAGQQILAASPEVRLQVFQLAGTQLGHASGWTVAEPLKALVSGMLRARVQIDSSTFSAVFNAFQHAYLLGDIIPLKDIADWFEHHKSSASELDASLHESLAAFVHHFEGHPLLTKALRKNMIRLKVVLGEVAQDDRHLPKAVDSWTHAFIEARSALPKQEQLALAALVDHAATAKGSKPTKTFLKKAAELRADLPSFPTLLETVLRAIGDRESPFGLTLEIAHTDLLRALVWLGSDDPQLSSALGEAAANCFRKIPGVGPLNAKVGSACANALARMGTAEAVGQLTRLQQVVKHVSTRKQLNKALEAAAKSAGMTRSELEEIAVPDFGFTELGVLETRFDQDFTAVLSLQSGDRPVLTWLNADGKTQKTVPKQIKEQHAGELKDLRKLVKEVGVVFPGQRHRIERLLLADRTLTGQQWRSRYADHPIVGVLARRLIWHVDDHLVAFADANKNTITNVSGNEIQVADDAQVRLWHPAESSADQVLAWREWLIQNKITQPFKQAHREIYLLTPAEEQTDQYSNRFASHILRQHVFKGLCDSRGWAYTLQGQWDSHNTPSIQLRDAGIRVEFLVDPISDDTGETGVYLYLSSDQVRFYRDDELLHLRDVSPRVFTEMMRDVDLFTAVCSIGNDPNWQDQGLATHREYWETASFGELNATAQSRHEVLERLLPGLKIADQCVLKKRFLVVRGHLRTYQIHLGSGSIRMSPNNQYLCIVPTRISKSKKPSVYLPFDDDHTLSMILSKAFLLAEDSKIKDRSIMRQIKSDGV